MKQLRTGIVGCGKVGHFHAKALSRLDTSDFCAVCGRTAEKTERFAAEYGVRAYTDVAAMCREEKLDVVCICTPHPLHAQPAIDAMNCGCHVIVEKPLAVSLKDCDAMLEAADRNGVKLTTIVQRRFYRPCMRIHDAIRDGKIGDPILGMVVMHGWRDAHYYDSDPWRGTWDGEGGGVLVNQAPHQLDLLLWYMGEIESVYGVWKNYNHPYIDVDDTAVATIQFKSGALGSVVVSNSQNPALYGKVHVFGSNGASVGVQTDGGSMFIAGMSSITEPPVNDLWTVRDEEEMLAKWKQEDSDFFNSIDNMYYFHTEQVRDFLDAILNGTEPLVSAVDGRRTVELFEAIYRCTKTGEVIKFPLS